MNLSEKHCVACEGDAKPLNDQDARRLLINVQGWELSPDALVLSRRLVMKNFISAVELINKIATIAETEDHHPDLHLTGYRNLTIALSTHAIKGLSENDFIVAAKINELPMELKK